MNIRKLRRKLDLTQAEFARALQIPKSTMCCYESGRIKPSFDVAYRMLNFFREHGIVTTIEYIRPQ